jgi:hypothetical protein
VKAIALLLLAFSAQAAELSIPLYTDEPAQGIRFKSADPAGIPPLQVGMAFEPSGGYSTWFNINATVARDGGGSFVEFMTPNRAGKMLPGATINAGLIDATPGNEGGDFEIMMPCRGVFSRGGYNCGVAMDGTVQAFYPTWGGDTSLGVANLPWGDAWITRLAVPYHKCADGSECMPILFGGLTRYIKVYAQ